LKRGRVRPTRRGRPLVRVEKGKGLKLLAKPQVVVTLPEACDTAMIRDGPWRARR